MVKLTSKKPKVRSMQTKPKKRLVAIDELYKEDLLFVVRFWMKTRKRCLKAQQSAEKSMYLRLEKIEKELMK